MKARNRKSLRGLMFTGLLVAILFLNGCSYEELACEVRDYLQLNNEEQVLLKDEDSGAVSARELEDVEQAPAEAVDGLKEEQTQAFHYNRLSEPEQKLYGEILYILQEHLEDIQISTTDSGEVEKVFQCVLNDHPEIFYVEGYTLTRYALGEELKMMTLSGTYSMTPEAIEAKKQLIDSYVNQCFASLPTGDGSQYAIARYVYEYLIENTEYDAGAPDNQNICSVFITHRSVCQGYAKATQYLLQKAGIEATLIMGTVQNGEGHAWNIVEMNGEQYYVDATNGDQPGFLEGGAVSLEEHKTTIYDYLCPFPQEYEQLYTASDEFPVPECTATNLNFYVLNQACFDTYDEQQIYDFCCMRLENGAAVVRFKFTSQEAFDAACQQWIQEGYVQKIAEYYLKMYGLSTVEYHYGILDNLKTIYFMF